MIEWYEMSETCWLSSVLFKGASYIIEKRADGYQVKVSTLYGIMVLYSGLDSFAIAKEKAEENLFWRMRK